MGEQAPHHLSQLGEQKQHCQVEAPLGALLREPLSQQAGQGQEHLLLLQEWGEAPRPHSSTEE